MNAKKSRLILAIAGSLSLAACTEIPELADFGLGDTGAESRAAGSAPAQAATRSQPQTQTQTENQSAPLNQRVSDNPFHEDDDSDSGGFDGGGFDEPAPEPEDPPSWTG